MVPSGIPKPVQGDEAVYLMSEDGNSGDLRGEPDRNGSHMAEGFVEKMVVGPMSSPARAANFPRRLSGRRHP